MHDIEREIKETNIRLCLDCGKCTVVCPVAQHDSAFNPRLIAKRRLTQKDHGVGDETIWSCLSCYMCVERCNYHVKFPRFIHSLRAEALGKGAQVHCSHGEAFQTIMHLMARGELKQNRLGWLPKDVKFDAQSDTLFFVGCAPYFDIMFNDLGVNTLDSVKGALKILNRANVPFNILANERCCGRDLLLQGDRKGFTALAKANIEEFSRHGINKIITNCPECYYTLKVDYHNMTESKGVEVVHLTQIIAQLLHDKKLAPGKLDKTVTYQDPCTLGRCSRMFNEPREILNSVEGLKLEEMEQNQEKALCCGATSWLQCGAVNRQIQKQRLAQAEASRAEILVTACPKCLIHLKCAQKSADGKKPGIEIQDLASLVAQALR